MGDIIISYNYLDKPRSQDLKSFKKKVAKILIHGFLHLLGFDHKKNKDYYLMKKKENLIFKKLNKSKRGKVLKNKQDIIKLIKNRLNNNDYLMVKASNATGFNKMINDLKGIK